MALSTSNLLQWIAHSRYLIKNYGSSIEPKYRYGIACEENTNNLVLATWLLDEVELYYNECSCLTEDDICNFIVNIQKLTQ